MTPRLSVLLPLCAAVVAAIGLIRPSFATECEKPEVMDYLYQHLICDQFASSKTCDGLNYKDYIFQQSKAIQTVKDKLKLSTNDAERFYIQTLLDHVEHLNPAKNLFVISMPHATNYNEAIKRYDCAATMTFDPDSYRKYMMVQLLSVLPTTPGSSMSLQMAMVKGDVKSMALVLTMYAKPFEQKLEQINPTFELHYSIQETENGTLVQYELPNIAPIN